MCYLKLNKTINRIIYTWDTNWIVVHLHALSISFFINMNVDISLMLKFLSMRDKLGYKNKSICLLYDPVSSLLTNVAKTIDKPMWHL